MLNLSHQYDAKAADNARHSSIQRHIPKIVVVGGGAGGLPLICKLGKQLAKTGRAEIILIDKNINHVWKPRLHELASGALDEATDFVNFALHSQQYHYRFERGSVANLDTEQKIITVSEVVDECGNTTWPEPQLPYDYLVIAVGSRSNSWAIPDVEQHCFFLDGINNALSLRKRLTNIFLAASKNRRAARIGVVGGGAAGVELCAEIARMSEAITGHKPTKNASANVEIHLFEGSPQLLPRLNTIYGNKFASYMDSLNISLHLGFEVVKVTPEFVISRDHQSVGVDTVIWAAGIIAPGWLAKVHGLVTNPINQIVVDTSLRCQGVSGVYALGDCCSVYKNGEALAIPPRAKVAKQMSDYLAEQIVSRVKGRANNREFCYRDTGSLIALSHYSSFGRLFSRLLGRSIVFEGALAMAAYRLGYWSHHAAVRGYRSALVHFLFRQLTRPRDLKLRLH